MCWYWSKECDRANSICSGSKVLGSRQCHSPVSCSRPAWEAARWRNVGARSGCVHILGLILSAPSANNSVRHAIFSCPISTESMMLDMLKVDQYPTYIGGGVKEILFFRTCPKLFSENAHKVIWPTNTQKCPETYDTKVGRSYLAISSCFEVPVGGWGSAQPLTRGPLGLWRGGQGVKGKQCCIKMNIFCDIFCLANEWRVPSASLQITYIHAANRLLMPPSPRGGHCLRRPRQHLTGSHFHRWSWTSQPKKCFRCHRLCLHLCLCLRLRLTTRISVAKSPLFPLSLRGGRCLRRLRLQIHSLLKSRISCTGINSCTVCKCLCTVDWAVYDGGGLTWSAVSQATTGSARPARALAVRALPFNGPSVLKVQTAFTVLCCQTANT